MGIRKSVGKNKKTKRSVAAAGVNRAEALRKASAKRRPAK